MADELILLQSLLLQHLGLTYGNCTKDLECEEYAGYNCQLANFIIKFRKAKLTPKKIGQFVTVWKRNTEGTTTPFTSSDPFDFYLILTQNEEQMGYFIFPRSILAAKGILTTANKEGKRGFRVYPDWDTPTNKQAIKTQQWQSLYFVDCTSHTPQIAERVNNIIRQRE